MALDRDEASLVRARLLLAGHERVIDICAAINSAANDREAVGRIAAILECDADAARFVAMVPLLRLASLEFRARLVEEIGELEAHQAS